VAYNLQIDCNQIKLSEKYESVTQKVFLFIEEVGQNAKQLQHARLSYHVRWPSGISLQMFLSICGVSLSIAATILSFSSSRKIIGML
jgi:hypothetical protein